MSYLLSTLPQTAIWIPTLTLYSRGSGKTGTPPSHSTPKLLNQMLFFFFLSLKTLADLFVSVGSINHCLPPEILFSLDS